MTPKEQMLNDLTVLLEKAKRGELRALGFVALTEGHLMYRATADREQSQLEMMGALRRLEIHLDDQMFEDELEQDDLLNMADETAAPIIN